MGDLFGEQLQALRARSLHRKLREIGSAQGSVVDLVGQRLVNFSSNDYLGLANDQRLRDAATVAIAEFGVGAGSSRLISGTQSPHLTLESALAKWTETPAALCFSSGYAAAVGTLPALAGKGDGPHDVIFNHLGNRISGVRDARSKLHLIAAKDKQADPNRRWIDPRGPDGVTLLAPYEQYQPSDYPGLRTGDATVPGTLFDLANDPGEQRDVAAQHPDVVQRLRARYEAFIKTLPPN